MKSVDNLLEAITQTCLNMIEDPSPGEFYSGRESAARSILDLIEDHTN